MVSKMFLSLPMAAAAAVDSNVMIWFRCFYFIICWYYIVKCNKIPCVIYTEDLTSVLNFLEFIKFVEKEQ